MDEENYSLTWHVVPTVKLKFEAVIGSDILEQASVNFTKNGVEFVKYENQALLMQMSAENIEEVELNHIIDLKVKKELKKLIENYKPEKIATTDVTMRIILKDNEPVCQSPRRLAFTEREEVNKQIEEWLKEGIIRPSSSEYASLIVLVKKKDGTSRMYIDYRKVDQNLVKDKFPLPLIEDVLDTLQEAKVYSSLDLRNGFFHVSVDEDCRKFTSFIVPDGQFEFNKVPFGLSTSPGVFQLYVTSIFRDLTRKGILIGYMDDLIIPSKDEKEGLQKLKVVFEVAKKYGLEIKFKKCQFLMRKVEFLGHIVENGTIKLLSRR
ncbi:Retrovirus-related Pol polyprotein from transposon 412 [Araneus ventricosus]|uniref:Retrovirus-related Pol polyprotein from transposon 412 n=1 Tax=Araneus ventricosus TaxID=182803 RepID=A0A4Y2TAQ0_ARAVE|nr:Retrovirus-related Pol polyprotein from transposon 412 [Araneus ventricosus]